jgi:probable HAF family extracellular repeat protein
MKEKASALVIVTTLLVMSVVVHGLPPRYDVVTVTETHGSPEDLNELSQVAGRHRRNGREQAYFWSTGSLTDLGTLGTGSTPVSEAYGINDSGHVAGVTDTGDGFSPQAFIWTQNQGMQDIGSASASSSMGFGINNSDQVVGWSHYGGQGWHAFLWASQTGMIDLGRWQGGGGAYDINDAGMVVGGYSIPFMWTQGDGMVSLGDLGGDPEEGSAYAVNNNGQIVGRAGAPSGAHAFLWEDGDMIDLGTLGGRNSSAFDINDAGVVVGQSWTSDDTAHGFVWEDGVMYDLNDLVPDDAPFGRLVQANAINDKGEILIQAQEVVGYSSHAYLLVPVPEPATLTLLTLGGLAILRRRRKR